ncbi:MAG: hypothetical protein K2U26_07410, partial [Cyclobacteriaceae bacterium]|nr:hypothetical protein [Cyclobacteriaceae bacterium]
KLRATFLSGNDAYFKSDTFGKILAFVQGHSRQCRLKDQVGRPSLIIENISSVENALKILSPLVPSIDLPQPAINNQ